MIRFSLKTMLVLFTAVAVSTAGLIYANILWAAFFYTVAFLAVLTGIVGALVRRGPMRAFWIGFALFGGGYFGLALIGENSLAQFASNLQRAAQPPKLATTQLLLWVDRAIHPEPSNSSGRGSSGRIVVNGGMTFFQQTPSQYLVEIGHSIFTLALAFTGGWLGLFISRRPAADAPSDTASP